MDKQALIQEATAIKEEKRDEWNSANRIGSFLLNLIDFVIKLNDDWDQTQW